jgi:hypothetical protein
VRKVLWMLPRSGSSTSARIEPRLQVDLIPRSARSIPSASYP